MTLTIALDAMGGDHAPQVVIAGADMARERHPELRFLLFGEQGVIAPLLAARKGLAERCTVEHTPDRVGPDTKPSQALRQGRSTSMRLAVDAVKDGRASAAVSAGNTGALMALSKFVLDAARHRPAGDRLAVADPMKADARCSISAPMPRATPRTSCSSR